MVERFYSTGRYRWFWFNLVFLLVCVAAYVIVSPTGGHNGGTPLGYTLGSLSTLGILYLTWFGIRKPRLLR